MLLTTKRSTAKHAGRRGACSEIVSLIALKEHILLRPRFEFMVFHP